MNIIIYILPLSFSPPNFLRLLVCRLAPCPLPQVPLAPRGAEPITTGDLDPRLEGAGHRLPLSAPSLPLPPPSIASRHNRTGEVLRKSNPPYRHHGIGHRLSPGTTFPRQRCPVYHLPLRPIGAGFRAAQWGVHPLHLTEIFLGAGQPLHLPPYLTELLDIQTVGQYIPYFSYSPSLLNTLSTKL